MAKGAYIGAANEQAEHYKVLKYIECTGEQYITTSYYPTQDSGVVLDFEATGDLTKNNNMFGGRYTTSRQAFTFRIDDGKWSFGYSNTYDTGVAADNKRHILQIDKNVCKMDGTTIYEANYTSFKAYASMYIGRIHAYGSGEYKGYMKIYSCKVYDNGVLIRDLIPCVNQDGEAGMYDIANARFHANIGSGEFVLGEETGEVIGAGVAQEISDCYIGIDGVAQEVRRAYIGDENGIAQVCYSLNPYFIPAGASRLITADGEIFECKE